MVFPSVTSSRVLAIASLTITLGTISSVILRAVSTGTPFTSRVERVRANWPKRFNRTALPNTGAFIFHWSIFRLPCGVDLKRTNRTTIAAPTNPIMNQLTILPKNSLMLLRMRVASGNSTFKPSKMVMNFGNMKVMKKMMMTMPTQATTAG